MSVAACITGLGAVSGFGLGVEPLWQGLCAGHSAVRLRPDLPFFKNGGPPPPPVSLVPLPEDGETDPLVTGMPRASTMVTLAAREALADAGLLPLLDASAPGHAAVAVNQGSIRIGVCIGTTHGEKNPWLAAQRDGSAQAGALRTSMHGPAYPAMRLAAACGAVQLRVVSTACASGNSALAVALEWIRRDVVDVVLCGGCDALSDFVLRGFQSLRALSPAPCRPFDVARTGLNLGEGAALLVLESVVGAQARGARVQALLRGAGQACDANHMTGPDREGRGAARAMAAALQDAALSPADIDFVSAHGTATVFNDLMEAQALARVFGAAAPRLPLHSIKGAIGHSMGAAAALEAVVCARALQAGYVPGTAGLQTIDPAIALNVLPATAHRLPMRHVLSTASGFGGLNGAVVLSHADGGRTA